jgi:hypothetical protein
VCLLEAALQEQWWQLQRHGKSGSGRGCKINLQCSNLILHLLQESFSWVSHGGINSDRLSSVNDEGLKSLLAVRQCLVRK